MVIFQSENEIAQIIFQFFDRLNSLFGPFVEFSDFISRAGDTKKKKKKKKKNYTVEDIRCKFFSVDCEGLYSG